MTGIGIRNVALDVLIDNLGVSVTPLLILTTLDQEIVPLGKGSTGLGSMTDTSTKVACSLLLGLEDGLTFFSKFLIEALTPILNFSSTLDARDSELNV